MLNFIQRHWKALAIILACLALFISGYAVSSWRHSANLADYDKREAARMAEIATKDAEQNQLRGANETLRAENATLSAKQEAIDQNIKEHGGSILVETKKLEAIDVQLAKDEQVIKAPADKCVRCRRFSDVAMAQRLIDRPLSCKDECGQ